jgi:hypothetical protein
VLSKVSLKLANESAIGRVCRSGVGGKRGLPRLPGKLHIDRLQLLGHVKLVVAVVGDCWFYTIADTKWRLV